MRKSISLSCAKLKHLEAISLAYHEDLKQGETACLYPIFKNAMIQKQCKDDYLWLHVVNNYNSLSIHPVPCTSAGCPAVVYQEIDPTQIPLHSQNFPSSIL